MHNQTTESGYSANNTPGRFRDKPASEAAAPPPRPVNMSGPSEGVESMEELLEDLTDGETRSHATNNLLTPTSSCADTRKAKRRQDIQHRRPVMLEGVQ